MMEILSPSNPNPFMAGHCFTGELRSAIPRGLKRSYSVAFPTHTSMRPSTLSAPDRIETQTALAQAVSSSLSISRRHSEPPQWLLRNPATTTVDTQKSATDTIRAPSPTPTELDDPEPEEHTVKLMTKGIKVRDYAYQPSSTSKPAIEVFDYQRVCAEYDFIIMRDPRDRPVPGKTLRRLLDLGFISEAEQNVRWREMDWEELRRYDARSSHYPSRGYPGNGVPVNGVPSLKMRTKWLNDFGTHLLLGERMMNRMQAQQIAAEKRAEQWRVDTERVMAARALVDHEAGRRQEADVNKPPESPKRPRLLPSPEPSPDPSPHSLPPGYRHVQTQPSGSSWLQKTPPHTRGPSPLSRGLARNTTFRQL